MRTIIKESVFKVRMFLMSFTSVQFIVNSSGGRLPGVKYICMFGNILRHKHASAH